VKLLPCPFCGIDAAARLSNSDGSLHQVFCPQCLSGTDWHIQRGDIETWNSRAVDPVCYEPGVIDYVYDTFDHENPKN
jgi:hypothetical protein